MGLFREVRKYNRCVILYLCKWQSRGGKALEKFVPNRRSVIFKWLLSYISILIVPLLVSGLVYMGYSRALRSEINDVNAALLRQVKSDVDARLSDTETLSVQIGWNPRLKSLIADRSENYPADAYNLIMRDFKVYRMSNSFIENFYILLKDKNAALSNVTVLRDDLYEQMIDRYRLLSNGEPLRPLLWNKHASEFITLQEESRPGEERTVVALLQSLPLDSSVDVNATLLILLNNSQLTDTIRNIQWIDRSVVLLLDENDNILASSEPYTLPTELRYSNLDEQNDLYTYTDESGRAYTVAHTTSDVIGWKYVSITPNEVFFEKSNDIRRITYITILCSLLLGLVMSLFFVKSNYLPVRKLVGVLADKAGIPFDQRHNEFGFIEDALSSTLGDKQKVDRVLDKQLQHLRQSFLGRLLKGRVDPSMSVQEALSLYDLHFSSDDFAVMVFYIKEIEGKALGGMDREKQFQLARYIIRNVFEELIGRKHFGLITEVDDLQAALCNLSPGAADPEGDLADAAREGLQFLQENFGIHISVTQSTVMHSLEEIPAAYTEAYTATEYNILMGRADLTSYRDIELGLKEGNQTYYYYYPLQVEVQLTNFIKSGDYNNAKKILNELFEINFKQFSLPSMITKCFMFNLTSTIMKTIYEITAPDHNDLSELGAVERLLGCQSVTEMDMELNKILIRLCEYTREKNEASDLIRRAVQYIQKHYSDEALSITQIAEQLSLSPSYLSKRFKEVHGLGLLDYINKTRIEAAKVLLTGTERTIQEIAESCGFTGSNTFIRTFKKYEGITPGKYREVSSSPQE